MNKNKTNKNTLINDDKLKYNTQMIDYPQKYKYSKEYKEDKDNNRSIKNRKQIEEYDKYKKNTKNIKQQNNNSNSKRYKTQKEQIYNHNQKNKQDNTQLLSKYSTQKIYKPMIIQNTISSPHNKNLKLKRNDSSDSIQSNKRQKQKIQKVTKKKLFYKDNTKKQRKQKSIQLDSHNQFISQIQQKKNIIQNSKYIYKKHIHQKGQNKKLRLINKLGFIVDLAEQDQIASVSYYSSSNSSKKSLKHIKQIKIQKQKKQQVKQKIKQKKIKQKQEIKNKIKQQNTIKYQAQDNKKYETKKNSKNELKKQKNITIQNKRQQKQIKNNIDITAKKQIKIINKIKQYQPIQYNKKQIYKIQRQSPTQNNIYNNQKNKLEIKIQPISYQIPKQIKQLRYQPQQKQFHNIKLKQHKQQSINIKNHTPRNQNSHFNTNYTDSDEQLMSIIKMNDNLIENQGKNNLQQDITHPKYTLQYNHSNKKYQPQLYLNKDESRRRFKTQIDTKYQQYTPLNHKQRRYLSRLKQRQNDLMQKIKNQFYNSKSKDTFHTINTPNINHFYALEKYMTQKLKPMQHSYQISRILPTVTQIPTSNTNRFKQSSTQFSQSRAYDGWRRKKEDSRYSSKPNQPIYSGYRMKTQSRCQNCHHINSES